MLLDAGRLNESKTKDMIIDFRKSYSSSPAIRWTVTGTGVVLDETTKTISKDCSCWGEWDLLMSLKCYRHFIESVICRFGNTTLKNKNRLGLNSQQTLRVLARRAFGHQACAEEGSFMLIVSTIDFTVSLTCCPVAIVLPVRRTKRLRVSPFIPTAARLLVALAAKLTSPCGTIKFWIEWNKDLVTLMSAGRVSKGARL